MKLVSFNCPNCGGDVPYVGDSDTIVCEYCGKTLVVQNELDKKQADNAPAINEVMDRVYDLIRQGEFVKAEAAAENALLSFPYSGLLHLCLLMCELNVVKPSMLGNYGKDYTRSRHFQNCIRYMTTQDKKDLLSLVEQNKKTIVYDNDSLSAGGAVNVGDPLPNANNGIITQTLLSLIRQEKGRVVNQNVADRVGLDVKTLDEYFERAIEDNRTEFDTVFSVDEIQEKLPPIMKKITDRYLELINFDKKESELAIKEEDTEDEYGEENEYSDKARTKKKDGNGKERKKGSFSAKITIIMSSSMATMFLLLVILAATLKKPIINLMLLIVGIFDIVLSIIVYKIVDLKEKYVCPNCGARRVHHRQFLRTDSKSTSSSKVEYYHKYYDTYSCPECGETYSCYVTKNGGYIDGTGDHTNMPNEF